MRHPLPWIVATVLLSLTACCGGGTTDTTDPSDFTDGQEISCIDSPVVLGTAARDHFTVTCPPDCAWGSVWGTDTYTADSSICFSAIHAGVIDRSGGRVQVTMKPGLQNHVGSDRNGVTSSDWGSYDRSFSVSSP